MSGPGTRYDLSDRDYRSLARFRHALRVFTRFSEEAARDAGLTPSQHQLLLAVRGWAGEGDPSVSEIAERLQLRPNSALELVTRAEEAGLVTRTVPPDDQRRHEIRLTRTGSDKLRSLSVLHRRELRRFRAEMNDILVELD
ncbi:MAG: MarR family winged helix-turn-helix transcriptional regulator [Acidimicrobiia bacterium]